MVRRTRDFRPVPSDTRSLTSTRPRLHSPRGRNWGSLIVLAALRKARLLRWSCVLLGREVLASKFYGLYPTVYQLKCARHSDGTCRDCSPFLDAQARAELTEGAGILPKHRHKGLGVQAYNRHRLAGDLHNPMRPRKRTPVGDFKPPCRPVPHSLLVLVAAAW